MDKPLHMAGVKEYLSGRAMHWLGKQMAKLFGLQHRYWGVLPERGVQIGKTSGVLEHIDARVIRDANWPCTIQSTLHKQ